MAADKFPAARQEPDRLKESASLGSKGINMAPVYDAIAPLLSTQQDLNSRVEQIEASSSDAESFVSCFQELNFSFFFDGTGNNRDADAGTNEQSNVARLYDSHYPDDKSIGRYRIYIPGIGTYFREIKDPGDTTSGKAFGGDGEKRLDWAFDQFKQKLKHHEEIAKNPKNQIVLIRVSAFGFSRGATEARAFARMFQEICEPYGKGWRLKEGKHAVRFYFLGLWDTVASVGLPMSTNNTALAQSAQWMSTERALKNRNMTTNSVSYLAFGEPGADPSPGVHDGHMSWADGLHIVSMVEKCVHMVAGHEVRNSFPVDSCVRNGMYPPSVEEMVYPGVHSDVGGGYRPGESARSPNPGQMLSAIPLRAMHQKASENGVPLYNLSSLSLVLRRGFSADEASHPEFVKMNELWGHYMKLAGYGGKPIGQMMNSHMRLYYGWRFYKIRLNNEARGAQHQTQDEAILGGNEAKWDLEKKKLKQEMAEPEKNMKAANRRLDRAKSSLAFAEQREMDGGPPVQPRLREEVDSAQIEADEKSDIYLKLKARFDTMPGTEGALARNLRVYDQQLLADVKLIRETLKYYPELKLRPHYKNLTEAHDAEFLHSNGLRDPKIIEFFDTYVHDSLAGFAIDATLPSDPRVVYVGGDVKSLHAMNLRDRPSSTLVG